MGCFAAAAAAAWIRLVETETQARLLLLPSAGAWPDSPPPLNRGLSFEPVRDQPPPPPGQDYY